MNFNPVKQNFEAAGLIITLIAAQVSAGMLAWQIDQTRIEVQRGQQGFEITESCCQVDIINNRGSSVDPGLVEYASEPNLTERVYSLDFKIERPVRP